MKVSRVAVVQAATVNYFRDGVAAKYTITGLPASGSITFNNVATGAKSVTLSGTPTENAVAVANAIEGDSTSKFFADATGTTIILTSRTVGVITAAPSTTATGVTISNTTQGVDAKGGKLHTGGPTASFVAVGVDANVKNILTNVGTINTNVTGVNKAATKSDVDAARNVILGNI